MAEDKAANPGSVGLSDIRQMKTGEFRQYTAFRLDTIDEKLRSQDMKFLRLENRIWWVLGSVVTLGVVAILAAVL